MKYGKTLTPALSLSERERENRCQSVGESYVAGCSEAVRRCPRSHRMGGGQGEGIF